MLIRFPLALLAGVIMYMIAMMMTTYDGFISLIFQPIMTVLLTGISLTILTVVGSPLLFSRIWRVWRRLWVIPLIICVGGMAAMILSWQPDYLVSIWDSNERRIIESPNPSLGIGGWRAMLFGILYQPRLCWPTTDGRWIL